MKTIVALLLIIFTHLLSAEISLLQQGEQLRIEIDGQLFTEYRTDRHVPCLYPLMSPDGTHLTRQFPFVDRVAGEQADHPHHIGFWFAHGSVNGHDFWHGRSGERIVTASIAPDPPEALPDGSRLRFTAELDWMAGDTKILSEKRTYSILAQGKDRVIEVSCELKATEGDIVFGDTKEGSFALRVAPTMRLNGKVAQGGITNSEGIEGRKAWGKRAKWVAFHGPDSGGTPSVAAILDHPDNLRHPNWWHARDYGLLTANPFGARAYGAKDYPGSGDYRLKAGETLTLNYQLLLHQGDLASAKLDKRWSEFAGRRTILALGESITAGGKGYPANRAFLAPELAHP